MKDSEYPSAHFGRRPLKQSCVCVCHFLQTRRQKGVDLFVGDGHNGVVEFLQKVGDVLVGQEDGHARQQQVDEDEHHREDVPQAGFTESPRWAAALVVILCSEREQGGQTHRYGVKLSCCVSCSG